MKERRIESGARMHGTAGSLSVSQRAVGRSALVQVFKPVGGLCEVAQLLTLALLSTCSTACDAGSPYSCARRTEAVSVGDSTHVLTCSDWKRTRSCGARQHRQRGDAIGMLACGLPPSVS